MTPWRRRGGRSFLLGCLLYAILISGRSLAFFRPSHRAFAAHTSHASMMRGSTRTAGRGHSLVGMRLWGPEEPQRGLFSRRMSALQRLRGDSWRSAGSSGRYRRRMAQTSKPTPPVSSVDGVPPTTDEGNAGSSGVQWFRGIREDVSRKLPYYVSDFRDGFCLKAVSAILFLFPAVLMPAVAFGVIADMITGGAISVLGYLVGCGLAGISYALLSGQPMTFIGPTGLTLAFMVALHQFCMAFSMPFMALYCCVGLWTSLFLLLLAAGGASSLIRHCTQFTDDVFNALLALNFIAEAMSTLGRSVGGGGSGALAAVNLSFATFVLVRRASKIPTSKYGTAKLRRALGDFGPSAVIMGMTALCSTPYFSQLGVETMGGAIPSSVAFPTADSVISGIASRLAAVTSLPLWAKLGSILPAGFLTALFFLDQNISSRIVNSPRHGMRKGAAYNLDMVALASITGGLSVLGLPWMCATTVQSLNHVSAMSEFAEPGQGDPVDGAEKVSERLRSQREGSLPSAMQHAAFQGTIETRVTGLVIHALVLGSLTALPLLQAIPVPVVAGIFFVLGRTVMSGNDFLNRIKEAAVDPDLLPADSISRRVGRSTALRYTMVQIACLAGLWTLKSSKRAALFFPSVIGLLVLIRNKVLPRLFSKEELAILDRSAS